MRNPRFLKDSTWVLRGMKSCNRYEGKLVKVLADYWDEYTVAASTRVEVSLVDDPKVFLWVYADQLTLAEAPLTFMEATDLTYDLTQVQLAELLYDILQSSIPVSREALQRWRGDHGLPPVLLP